ncbi:MAG: hypothetical protein VX944_13060, partial [Myxococcota bacterium]|nr:hypothetical protein [Myxococcota bacterium]
MRTEANIEDPKDGVVGDFSERQDGARTLDLVNEPSLTAPPNLRDCWLVLRGQALHSVRDSDAHWVTLRIHTGPCSQSVQEPIGGAVTDKGF